MRAVLGFAIAQLSGLSADTYLPIIPAGSWMGMTLVNASAAALFIATDPDDADTVYEVPAGEQFMIQAVFGPTGGNGGATRFTSGAPAFWVKTASGDGTGVMIVWA